MATGGTTITGGVQRRSRDDAQDVRFGSGGESRDGSESPQIPNANGGAGSGIKERRGRGGRNGDGIDKRFAVRHDVGSIGRG